MTHDQPELALQLAAAPGRWDAHCGGTGGENGAPVGMSSQISGCLGLWVPAHVMFNG